MLLFPYAPIVNYVNHNTTTTANVRLAWSQHPSTSLFRGKHWMDKSPADIQNSTDKKTAGSGLLLELVALRDIRAGEEILLDYGPDFQQAWDRHVETWTGIDNDMDTPAHIMDDIVSKLRTEQEQQDYPYPDNLLTSCFYEYSLSSGSTTTSNTNTPKPSKKKEVTTVKWNMTRNVFDWKNLRPCLIVQRTHNDRFYTVLIKNRPGLTPSQRIPRGVLHMVSHVPRQAIRFSNKLYTTDQHLPTAFRHSIGIPDNIFPDCWKDLEDQKGNKDSRTECSTEA